jgi:hypothetical protein
MSRPPETLRWVGALFTGVTSWLCPLGCSTREPTVDPTKLYGFWAAEWPSTHGAQAAGVACGAPEPPLRAYCERLQLAISPVPPDGTGGPPQQGRFEAILDVGSFGCVFPWSLGETSDVLQFPIGAGSVASNWPKAPKGTFHVVEFWVDHEQKRVLNCALKVDDILVCRELQDRSEGTTPQYAYAGDEFHFRRVDALQKPMLCDRVLEQALLLGELKLPWIGGG